MKLADVIKPGTSAEIELLDGTTLTIGVPGAVHEIEYLDDSLQQLGFSTTITTGRHRGHKAKMIVPYSAIKCVTAAE